VQNFVDKHRVRLSPYRQVSGVTRDKTAPIRYSSELRTVDSASGISPAVCYAKHLVAHLSQKDAVTTRVAAYIQHATFRL
jgi:hypothetical protein